MTPSTFPSVAPVAPGVARWPYRLATGLLVVFIALGALLDVSRHPEALAGIRHLGYPDYFVRYIGVLKLLGVAALLVPGRWPRVREWAYAGLFFDTTGALYSAIANGDAPATWLPAAIGVALTLGAYALYHRRDAALAATTVTLR